MHVIGAEGGERWCQCSYLVDEWGGIECFLGDML